MDMDDGQYMKGSWPHGDLQYAMLMLGGAGGAGGGGGINSFGSEHLGLMGSATNSGLSGDCSAGDADGDGNLDIEIATSYCGRWPKEETLALLQIRSRLDSNFRQTNHKGPLWDQISRIMCVEHGYKRSGKKCSEKFENLYKYYKKIKEGKAAGRLRDKKRYQFFRQLEAIYGEKNTTTSNPDDSNKNNNISVTKAKTTLIPPFLEDNDHHCVQKTRSLMVGKKKKKSSSWITDLIETKVNTLMEKQDKWMEKVMHTIQEKEKERISKQEQWRKQAEAARFEKQTKFRSNEQAWIESRDLALIEALNKLTKNKSTLLKDDEAGSCIGLYSDDQINKIVTSYWEENEIRQLIQLRSSMETRFEAQQQCGYMEDVDDDVVWEEIALRMACLGYNRNAFICKAKWDHILRNKKKQKCSNLYSDQHNYMINIHQAAGGVALNDHQQNNEGYSRVLMSDPAEIMGNYYGNIQEI